MKYTLVDLPNGRQVKVEIIETMLPDHVVDIAARSYGYEVRFADSLYTSPSMLLRKKLVKVI